MFEKEAEEYVDDYFYDLIEKVQEKLNKGL